MTSSLNSLGKKESCLYLFVNRNKGLWKESRQELSVGKEDGLFG